MLLSCFLNMKSKWCLFCVQLLSIMAAPISSRECLTVFLCFSGTDDHVSKLSDVSHTLPDKRVGVLYLKKWVCSVLSFFWPNPLINKLTIAIIISARAPQKMCFKREREREKSGISVRRNLPLPSTRLCTHTRD